jgi:predicted nucleic acid-binding protein
VILDTNGLSAIADGDRSLERFLMRAPELAIPVIVLGEYRYGIADSRLRVRYERWLIETLAGCRILRVDEETAIEYASIRRELKRSGRPIPSNDIWIAALARQHSLPVLSLDQHFDFVPHLERIAW